MLWPSDHQTLQAAGELLSGAGFQPSTVALPDSFAATKLMQSPEALVALVGSDVWRNAAADVKTLANVLAKWSLEHPEDCKSCDLYLLVLLKSKLSPEEARQARLLEGDIKHVRKLVRTLSVREVPSQADALSEALRPFLPLSSIPALASEDPLGAIESELSGKKLSPELLEKALESFRSQGEVILT
jgi:hypothetical protein